MGSGPDDLDTALAACAKGDRNALCLVFDRKPGRLIAVAERIVKRRELAEEVRHYQLQETISST
jgi:RNA polymerase sigma-70 factor (ECF subfamily)